METQNGTAIPLVDLERRLNRTLAIFEEEIVRDIGDPAGYRIISAISQMPVQGFLSVSDLVGLARRLGIFEDQERVTVVDQ